MSKIMNMIIPNIIFPNVLPFFPNEEFPPIIFNFNALRKYEIWFYLPNHVYFYAHKLTSYVSEAF